MLNKSYYIFKWYNSVVYRSTTQTYACTFTPIWFGIFSIPSTLLPIHFKVSCAFRELMMCYYCTMAQWQ